VLPVCVCVDQRSEHEELDEVQPAACNALTPRVHGAKRKAKHASVVGVRACVCVSVRARVCVCVLSTQW